MKEDLKQQPSLIERLYGMCTALEAVLSTETGGLGDIIAQ